MRVKVSIFDTPIEVEAETKQQLQDSLEVVLAALSRFQMPSNDLPVPPNHLSYPPNNSSFRESETVPEVKENPIHTSPLDESGALGGAQSANGRSLNYKKAKSVTQNILIAIADLGELYGTDRYYTNNEILDHMMATGAAKSFTRRKSKPIAIVGQATRATNRLLRVEDDEGDLLGYKMQDWLQEDAIEQQASPAEQDTVQEFSS